MSFRPNPATLIVTRPPASTVAWLTWAVAELVPVIVARALALDVSPIT